MKIHIGTCGFSTNMKNYFEIFDTIEIQQTFYKIPQLKTLQKWKELAKINENFIFNIKSFQGITHPINLPTWKRFGKEIPGKKENYGNLQPTKEVLDSWNKTLEAAKILNAKIVLIQTPPSFKDEEKNLENAEKFFSKVSKDIEIAFEPRGWKKENIEKICKKFDLIHCVDPFLNLPLSKSKISYFRLHGSYEKGKINYKHKYSEKELKELKNKIKDLKANEIFILFNNVYMKEDALAAKKIFES